MNDENSLARRLINAENELLALKTAHKRGLGTIKLYSILGYIHKEATASPFMGDVAITVSIDRNSEPFPLISLACKYTTSAVGQILMSKLKASSDGYTIYILGDAILPAAKSDTVIKVISTSDIESIDYQLVG